MALRFTPDGSRLASADQNGVDLIDPDTAKASRVVDEFGVWDVGISPDGRYLATATRDPDVNPHVTVVRELELELTRGRLLGPTRQPVPAIKVWRVADGTPVRTLPGHTSVAYNPDGRLFAGARGANVILWDSASGAELRTLAGPTEPVLKVQFAAGGRQVVGFTRRRATVWDAGTGRIVAAVDGLDGPAVITPDGRRIVGTGAGIRWWDVQLGRELLLLPLPGGESLSALALSADGRRVAAAGGNKLLLWEAGIP